MQTASTFRNLNPTRGPPTIPALAFLDIAAWSRKPIPPREWVVPDLIPAKNVAVLSGHGATGKTTLALQLCAATALGRGWLNYLPEPGPAMAVCCEDDADELHRRMADIASHYGVEVSDLTEDLHLLSRAGEDGVLGSPDRFGIIRSTKLFEQIRTAARKIRPRLRSTMRRTPMPEMRMTARWFASLSRCSGDWRSRAAPVCC